MNGTNPQINLADRLGLPVSLDPESGALTFGCDVQADSVSHRELAAMREVLADPEAPGPDPLYTMYRNVGTGKGRQLAADHLLRYDLTVLRPGAVGRELVKTAGHYHPVKAGTKVTYTEVYEVLYGTALYQLHPTPADAASLPPARRIWLIAAQPGDKVVIPPGYGHITINAGSTTMVMSNWVAAGFESLYEPMRVTGGGAVFVLQGHPTTSGRQGHPTGGGLDIRPNPRFVSALPGPTAGEFTAHRLRARDVAPLGLVHGQPMWTQFLEAPHRFRFLAEPETAAADFEQLLAAMSAASRPQPLG